MQCAKFYGINMYFLNLLLDDVDKGLALERKIFVRYNIYHFFLKAVMGDLN